MTDTGVATTTTSYPSDTVTTMPATTTAQTTTYSESQEQHGFGGRGGTDVVRTTEVRNTTTRP